MSKPVESPPDRLPILTWHAVDETRSAISITPALFRWQMEALASLGLRGISLAEAFEHRSREGGFPQNTVVLTFDDAYRCLADHVLPVMRAQGFHATVFVATAFVGLDADAARSVNADINRDILDWGQLRAFSAAGWEIGSHTVNHPDLARLPQKRKESEILEARRRIELETGCAADSFAYPYGRYDHAAREAAAAHHARACTTRLGFNDGMDDPFQLERLDVYFLRNPRVFRHACQGGLAGYFRLRQYLRNLKTHTP